MSLTIISCIHILCEFVRFEKAVFDYMKFIYLRKNEPKMSIKLKKITFEGFKSPDRTATIKFCNDNISIVYGDNGSGKTSLLKGLYSFLIQDEDYLKSLNTKRIICSFISLNKNTHIEQTVEVKYSDEKFCFDWRSFEKSLLAETTSLSIAIERGLGGRSFSHLDVFDVERFFETKHSTSNFLNHLSKSAKNQMAMELYTYLTNVNKMKQKIRSLNQDFLEKHAYVENLDIHNLEALIIKEYKDACFDDIQTINQVLLTALNVAIDVQTKSGPEEFKEQLSAIDLYQNKDRLIVALSSKDDSENLSTSKPYIYVQNRELKNRLVDFLKEIKNLEDAKNLVQNFLIGRIFNIILQQLNSNSSVVTRFNTLTNTFNEFLIDDKKLSVNLDQVEIQVKGDSHSLDDLSSGERHILTLLVCILFKAKNKDFLFIDEPEISLNLLWQERLLPLLTELVPNTQIIVASHSPFIVNDRSDCLSELVVKRS